MDKITAILIDDEDHNRNLLRTLLGKYCQLVDIIEEATNADEAFEKINNYTPQLIFLDIRMPKKSGFDLLKQFSTINFEVIFISAFDEYAITAFEFNALAYILKPIDYSKLIKAVDKAIFKINSNQKNENVLNFTKTLDKKNDLISKISVHYNDKVIFINICDIVSVDSNDSICEIKLYDKTRYFSSKQLKLFEAILEKNGNFVRINKSVIVNIDFIKSYSKGDMCDIELINGEIFEVSRRKKTEVLAKIITL